MNEDRRQFLKTAGRTAVGLGFSLPILDACTAAGLGHAPGESTGKQWGMVIDLDKCRLDEVRQACAEACHRAHNVPTNIADAHHKIHWIWTEPYRDVFPDQTPVRTAEAAADAPVLVLCNHCDNPPCVRVCPTQATWKRESDGIVMMDMHRCIGCRYCMAACPYGSRSFNWEDPRPYIERDDDGRFPSDYPTRTKGVVEKCNFCAERLRDGLEPACVEASRRVPGGAGALTFGDLSDPDSHVSRLLAERRTIARRVGLGTGPNVYYLVGGANPEGQA